MIIGVLTGGGDTSSLNSCLYGIVKGASAKGHSACGFLHGWKGILGKTMPMALSNGMINPSCGGTLLRTSRTKLLHEDHSLEEACANIEKFTDAFIAIGGDDTLSVGAEIAGMVSRPFIAITKTIDNDVGTNATPHDNQLETMVNYFTQGFPTAASRICEYVTQLRTTAYSHERVVLLEAMGRKPGWLALASAPALPDLIVVPEHPLDFEVFKEKVASAYLSENKRHAVIVIAEGARYINGDYVSADSKKQDSYGNEQLGGAAAVLAERLRQSLKGRLGTENFNPVVPGYLYRSGAPTVLDAKYAMLLGERSVDAICRGVSKACATVQMRDGDLYVEMKEICQVANIDTKGRATPRLLNSNFYEPVTMQATPLALSYFRSINYLL